MVFAFFDHRSLATYDVQYIFTDNQNVSCLYKTKSWELLKMLFCVFV